MGKLSPELLILLQEQKEKQKSRSLSGEEATDDVPTVVVHLKFEGDIQPILDLGLQIKNQTGSIVIGELPVIALQDLEALPNVTRIEKPSPPEISLDVSIPDVRADQVWSQSGNSFSGLTGSGVIVGVIDTGIDYTHKTFQNADGTTRILRIWDQTLTPQGSESSPGAINHGTLGNVALGYGVEYLNTSGTASDATIQKALNEQTNNGTDPFTICRHQDNDGHGTHVASTAAGNGSQNGNCHGSYHYIGVAPEADLIVVRLRGLTAGDPATVGGELTDAVRYILDRAGGTPCVINLSLGSNIGPRDGSGTVETAMDNILNAYSSGVAICQAAGNDGDEDRHIQGTVSPGGTLFVTFRIGSNSSTTDFIDLYYSGSNLRVRVRPHGGSFTSWVTNGNSNTFNSINNGGSVHVVNNTDNIWLRFTPPANGNNLPGDEWQLEINDTGSTSTDFHAWSSKLRFETNVFTPSSVMRNTSAANLIVVGAYHTEGDRAGELAAFSSRGPVLRSGATAAENRRPHISAPGVAITAAGLSKDREDQCCCACCQDYYVNMQGTSMATPHVTGAVALMLEKNDSQSFSDLRTHLQNTANTSVPGGGLPDNDWGWGKLDVKAATDAVPASTPLAPREAPTRQPQTVSFSSAVPPGVTSLRDRLFASENGRRYYQLFHHYFSEVRKLVNTNKRVATVWHRNGGPRLISLAMQAASQPQKPLPVEMEGIPLFQRMSNIVEILLRYGSDQLQKDLEGHRFLLELLNNGLSPEEILDHLSKGDLQPVPAS